MVDTPRAIVTLQGYFADNTTGDISAGNSRDHIATMERRTPTVRATDPEYGAVGDGNTDDATAIQAALDVAGAKIVHIDIPGTYMVGTSLSIPSSTILALGKGVILQWTAGAHNAELIGFANGATDAGVIGPGIVDGNTTNVTTQSQVAVKVSSGSGANATSNITIDGVTVQNAFMGIGTSFGDTTNCVVKNCYITATDDDAIHFECASAGQIGLQVLNNVVDRSAIADGATEVVGIEIDSPFYGLQVIGNHVVQNTPANSSADVCIRIVDSAARGAARIICNNNYVEGGESGLWIGEVSDISICGNVVYNSILGIQVQKPLFCTIAGNQINTNSLANSDGIVFNGASGHDFTVTGNQIHNAFTGILVGDTSSAHSNGSIVGNEIVNDTAISQSSGIWLWPAYDIMISGNMIDGQAAATAWYGLQLLNAYNISFNDNYVKNVAVGVGPGADTAITVDHLSFNNNHFVAATTPIRAYAAGNFTGGSAVGNFISAKGNDGLAANGNANRYDILDWKNNILDCIGTGSPASSVTAGIGSLYRRLDGGTNTTLYVKTSGTGNTTWSAK